jgi:ABC-type nitrate/sulfonate/bicarbonate transport system permease component
MRLTRFVIPLVLISIWQGLSYIGIIPENKFPSPAGVFYGFNDLLLTGIPPGKLLHLHIVYSLYRVGLGFVLGVSIAIPIGILIGWSKKLREIVNPIIEIIRPIPPLAWIPIAILWFGIGIKSAAFIIFLGVFFPVLLNTTSGVLSVNPRLLDAARSLGADNKDIFFKVLIPSSIPSIFTGMRIGIGIGWMTLVAAEFTGIREGYGLGYMIMTARDIQRPDEIIAGMLIIGLIGLGIDAILSFIEKRQLNWR